ncbi:MAG: DUF3611 family protein [Microcoleaceae cyanobacterium]
MSNLSDSSSIPPAAQRIAFGLRRGGWVCFWVQLVLAVISAIILLFASLIASREAGASGTSAGTGGGLIFAWAGLSILGFSTFRSFQYTRLAQKLKSPTTRPNRAETVKQIRMTLISNMIGMTLTLIGAEAINGILLGKALSQPRGFFQPSVNLQDFIQPLDIFIVLANTHTIVAHFFGIVVSMWLIDKIYKSQQR